MSRKKLSGYQERLNEVVKHLQSCYKIPLLKPSEALESDR